MRISERQRYQSSEARMNAVRQNADEAQQTAVSGRKLRRVSDDPSAMVRVLRNRNKLENIHQFRKNIDYARGYLARTETALLSMSEAITRARELAIQQSNATWDASARKSVGQEIKQIAEHVVNLGNSTYGDRYVFGGFQTTVPPVSPDGTFMGDDGMIFIQVDEDNFRPINVLGRPIFQVASSGGDGGTETPVVQVLRDMALSLETNDLEGLRSSMVSLDRSFNQVIDLTASLGARRTSVDDVAERLDHAEIQLSSDNNSLEGADPIKATMDLKRAETSLNHTLQASAKMLSPSLLQFLH